MEIFPDFKPFPLIKGHFTQTVVASFINFHKGPPSDRKFVSLPDEDKIALEITTPEGWKNGDLTVVLIHGLCGSHKSGYMMRMAKRLYKLGIKAVRYNMRGCGSGRGHAKKMYISEASSDVRLVLETLKQENPNSPIILIGFSLGGNISLKLAGELGERAKDLVQEVIAVSPPVNLETSARLLGNPKNWVYERYLTDLLVEDVNFRHKYFSDLPPIKLPHGIGIMDFDEMYLAPHCGFATAKEYYEASSSVYLIHKIRVPCNVLFAIDDPIIEEDGLDGVQLPDSMNVFKASGGGHMGFLSRPNKKTGVRWLDGVLLSWILKDNYF